MTKNKDDKSYDVGYKKPPKHSQFQKGESGNPSGRPIGATNKVTEESVLTHIAREAYREVAVNDGAKVLNMPLVLVAIRSLMQKAAKGDLRAIDKALELLEKVEEKGASDKAMLANKGNKSFEKYMSTLSLEELKEFDANMEKALNIRELSLGAIRQAKLLERQRKAEEVQASLREDLKRSKQSVDLTCDRSEEIVKSGQILLNKKSVSQPFRSSTQQARRVILKKPAGPDQ